MIPGFEIRRATPEDAPALALVNCIAFDKSNIMWKQLFKDVDQDDVIELVIGLIRKRMADGNVTFHVAVEKETKYTPLAVLDMMSQLLLTHLSTIVGGGGLAVPMKKPDTQFKPKMPAKVNEKLAAHFFNNVLTSSKSQGYDPEKHCRKLLLLPLLLFFQRICANMYQIQGLTIFFFRPRRCLCSPRIPAERVRFCPNSRRQRNCR